MSKTKKILITIILITVLLIGIGYAAIQNVTLNITGTMTADPSQANFVVRFTGTPSVSDATKVTAAITDDTNATINVEGLTASGETVTAIYTVENASSDLSADLTVETTNSNEEYFLIDAELAKKSIVAGETTTLIVTVELIKTPISTTETTTIEIELTATPVQPGEEGTTNGGAGGNGNISGLNEYGFYYGVPYSITENDTKYSYVFFEDGVTFVYENEIKVYQMPAGNIVYGEKTIAFDEETILHVSEDGTEIGDGTATAVAELGVSIGMCGVWGHSDDDGLDHTAVEECIYGHYNCEGACTTACTAAPCGILGHEINDGLDHTIVADCPTGHYVCQNACGTWEVPDGATYTMVSAVDGDKTVYSANETLPQCYQSQIGDIFTCGDYEYRYDQYFEIDDNEWQSSAFANGWGVRVIDDTKTVYGEIYSSINNTDIECLQNTFYGCTSLTESPEIPYGVVDMSYTFKGCTNLSTVTLLPDGVKFMFSTFADCTNLKTYVGSSEPEGEFSNYVIPTDVEYFAGTFSGCSSLITAPKILANVTNLTSTFLNCSSLTTAPEIPDSVTKMMGTFMGCSSLKDAPVIPTGVVDMTHTFYGCSSLTTAPKIPETVTDMSWTFSDCSSLVTPPEIPVGVTELVYTFSKCSSLTIAPSIPTSVTDMSGTFSMSSSLTVAPIIPSGVTSLSYTFASTNLKTYAGSEDSEGDFSSYVIPSSVTEMDGTFYECTYLTTVSEIPDSVTNMKATFYGCTSLTTAPKIPASLINMYGTFAYCTNLKTYVGSTGVDGDFSNYIISSNVTDMGQAFWECTSLILPPEIPENVTDMYGTFANCTALTTAPLIPATVTNVGGLFNDCTNLKTYVGSIDADGDFSAYDIPEGVTDMRWTFNGCSLLTTAPIIPESVTSMYRTFYKCTLLTGTIQINTDQITALNSDRDIMNNGYQCFYGTTKSIVLKGTGTTENTATLELLASTANNGNVTVE